MARNLKKFAKELSEDLPFTISPHMLRRFLKKLGYSWKRFRKSLKKKQDPQDYAEKLEKLKQIIELYNKDFIDLYFADESGFNLEGYVPYGWQPKGEYILITPQKNASTQVFGLMTLKNELEAYTFTGSLNSACIIACLDDFQAQINQPTVVVLDNAPIHHSHLFDAKVEEWKQQDLYIFFLPKYSPHLNPIEILWRMIKYQWLPYEELESQQQLQQQLLNILQNFGREYTIDFNYDQNRAA